MMMLALPAMAQVQFTNPANQVGIPGQNQLDSSQALFTVMVALNASGYDAEADSPTNSPLRKQIHDYFVNQRLDSLEAIRRFVRAHRQKDPNAELTQYISFALANDGPPEFSQRYAATALPPDVVPLDAFGPLLVAFYKEARLDQLWKKVQPYYDQAITQLQEPVARAVLQANAYLRNATSGYLGRRFQIYVDLLGAPNQVQTRSYVDDYFVVVTAATDLPIDGIRHAYLHYLLDPLPLKFSKDVDAIHALGDYAQGSPVLEDQYKSDFILLTTECLIKAVESRIDRKPASIEQSLREGFVLTPVLAEQLEAFEKQEASMRLYFPEMIEAIDLKHEEQRLDHIDFVSERAARRVRSVVREVPAPVLTGAARTLDEAEKAYTDRDLPRASGLYLRVLKETDEKPMHAKAYYGLARIKVLERDPEEGDHLFRQVLELDPDPETKSWSLLYLGRLADSQKRHDEAVEHYKAALAVEGAPESVRTAAEQGLKEGFVKK
jgi:tetratricopeptide (TPR) repeat protein